MLPAGEARRLAAEEHGDALAVLDAADDRCSVPRSANRGEQLEVLAERRDRRASRRRERHALELDHAADARAARDVAGVDGEAVRDVEQRVCGRARARVPSSSRSGGRT